MLRRIFTLCFILVLVVAIFLLYRHFSIPTFSSTATWNPELLAHADRPLKTAVDLGMIFLPPPPAPRSAEERADIDAVILAKELRTSERLAMIQAELDINSADFGGFTIAELLDTTNPHPFTAALVYAWDDLGTIIMQEKRSFDRARPHVLDSSIEPVIEVPGHPAYPSGHATQSFFIAYVLSDLFPERREQFMSRAEEIALNREIAGVHYPSDSVAGMTLAKQFYEAILEDPEFVRLMDEAWYAIYPDAAQQ